MQALVGAFLVAEATVTAAFTVFAAVVVLVGAITTFQDALVMLLWSAALFLASGRTACGLIFFVFHS